MSTKKFSFELPAQVADEVIKHAAEQSIVKMTQILRVKAQITELKSLKDEEVVSRYISAQLIAMYERSIAQKAIKAARAKYVTK